jgi:arylsulfatase A-like enzyme
MDLAPFVAGQPAPGNWRSEAHWEFDFRDAADDEVETELGLTLHQCSMNIVRGERYKYVHFTHLEPLFFDLERDPDEMENRVGDPACLPIVLLYAQKLLSWRMNHDEQTLTHVALTDDGMVARPSPRY